MKNSQTTVGKQAVYLTASQALTLVISMATGMLLARFRTKEEYGTYSSIMLVINLFSTIIMLGLPNSINYFLGRADDENNRKQFLSAYYTLCSVLSIILGIVFLAIMPLIEGYFHNNSLHTFNYYFLLYPWAIIISSSISNVLVVYNKTNHLVIYKVVYSTAFLLVILIAEWLGYGFQTYMKLYIASECFFALFVLLYVTKIAGRLKFFFDIKYFKTIFVFCIPLGLSTMVGTINGEIDKLLIGHLLDTEQLAVYTNAAKELPLAFVAASITAVLMPRMARMIKNGTIEKAVTLWKHSIIVAIYVIGFIVAGVVAYAEDVFTFLYSDKYIEGVNIFRVYTLTLLLRCTYFGIVLNSSGNTKKILKCSILSLVINAVLNPLFYYVFGVIGPAIATVVSISILQYIQLIMTARTFEIRMSQLFPWQKSGFVIFYNTLLGCGFFFLKKIIPLDAYIGSIPESIVLGLLWALLYFVLFRKDIKNEWDMLNKEGEE